MSDSKTTARRPRTRKGKRKPWQPRWANLAWLIASCAILSNIRFDRLGFPTSFRSSKPTELVSEAIPRTIMTSLMEAPTWEWGACSGVAPMYPPSICGRVYCLHSAGYPGTYIDLFYHSFQLVTDPSVLYMCEEPAGGQLGFRSNSQIQVSFIITYKDNPKRTVQCMLELFRTSREAESVEFVLVNDGSVNDTSVIDQVRILQTGTCGICLIMLAAGRDKWCGDGLLAKGRFWAQAVCHLAVHGGIPNP